MEPSWMSRAWTGSIGELPARPITIRRMAPPATAATMIGRIGIALDLDVHDLADDHEADEHHETAEAEDDDAGRKTQDGRWVGEHGLHEARCGDEQEARKADRQGRDHVGRQ